MLRARLSSRLVALNATPLVLVNPTKWALTFTGRLFYVAVTELWLTVLAGFLVARPDRPRDTRILPPT